MVTAGSVENPQPAANVGTAISWLNRGLVALSGLIQKNHLDDPGAAGATN